MHQIELQIRELPRFFAKLMFSWWSFQLLTEVIRCVIKVVGE
jgi:hypothetical protein